MATVELKDNESWKEFVKTDYSVIDCYGENCVACVMLQPIYDAVADEMSGIAFGRVNISYYGDIADKYGVNAMPTLLYFRNGEKVFETVGSIDREELLANISKLLYEEAHKMIG